MSDENLSQDEQETKAKRSRRKESNGAEEVVRAAPWMGLRNDDRIYIVKDHNKPRREGSKSAGHFQLYRDGMTIAEAKAEKQILPSKLKTDIERGRVTVNSAQ